MKIKSVLLAVSIQLSTIQVVWSASMDATGLQIAVAGDMVAELGLKSDSQAREKLSPRAMEIMLYAPVDHNFDAVASATAHEESGQVFFETHELWIGSSKLIPRTRFRIGQLFPAFGRLQRFHQHDWPFISAPEVHTRLIGKEGSIDTGGEVSYLFPLPFYLDLTAGATSGWTFGHSHNAGRKPKIPTHFARLATYVELGDLGGAEIGMSYVGRTSAENTETKMMGLDLTAKKRQGRMQKYLVQSELWYRNETRNNSPSEKILGAYVYGQYGINANFSVGVRLDGLSVLSQENALGQKEDNLNLGVVPTLTYHSSEFATFRLAYNQMQNSVNNKEVSSDRYLQFQATFILGAHSAHVF